VTTTTTTTSSSSGGGGGGGGGGVDCVGLLAEKTAVGERFFATRAFISTGAAQKRNEMYRKETRSSDCTLRRLTP